MRKNSPRKWLHAILDLLPLVILPIFALAVRSDNNFQPIEVQTQDYEVVDFNQLVKNGNFTCNSDWQSYQSTLTIDNNLMDITITPTTANYGIAYQRFSVTGKLLFSFYLNSVDEHLETLPSIGGDGFTSGLKQVIYDGTINGIEFYTYNGSAVISNVQLFNLTQMFGVGNEPTLQQFNIWYNESYYDYTLSHKELLNVGTTTLSDTDVGSQMVYTLYNATEKYFNFRQVGNFNDIYNWLELNMFNGNAPLIVPVVYNVILYELIMDIIFLLYAVFMFIVDFAERMLDCLFDKSFGGGR